MDHALEQITGFTVSMRPEDIPDDVIEHVTGILVDSIACAMAASTQQPVFERLAAQ